MQNINMNSFKPQTVSPAPVQQKQHIVLNLKLGNLMLYLLNASRESQMDFL